MAEWQCCLQGLGQGSMVCKRKQQAARCAWKKPGTLHTTWAGREVIRDDTRLDGRHVKQSGSKARNGYKITNRMGKGSEPAGQTPGWREPCARQ